MSVFDQIIDRGHERVCFHHDPVTGLRAIIAVHNTALGNALGGTRRWYYETDDDAIYDVLRLSQGMTYKSAVAETGLDQGLIIDLTLKLAQRSERRSSQGSDADFDRSLDEATSAPMLNQSASFVGRNTETGEPSARNAEVGAAAKTRDISRP